MRKVMVGRLGGRGKGHAVQWCVFKGRLRQIVLIC